MNIVRRTRPRLASNPALLLILAITAASTGCVPGIEVSESSAELIDTDVELRAHFDDAVRFCDQRLLTSGISRPIVGGELGDRALADYANPDARSVTIRRGPHANATAARDSSPQTNACINPDSVEHGLVFSGIQDGFCRADFNYCIGMELAAHAQSLPSGSAHTPLKAAILRRARERLQAAAMEYIGSLAYYERACVSDPGAPIPQHHVECSDRLNPDKENSYLPTAHDRLLAAIDHITSLAPVEAGLRVELGDHRQRARSALDEEGAIISALYGPEGSRTSAVAVLYGPPDGVAFETRWNHRRLVPVALPTVSPADERAVHALELIRRYRVPTAFTRSAASAPVQLGGYFPEAAFRVIDHRLAADRYLFPYDAADASSVESLRGTALRRRAAIEPALYSALVSLPFELHRSPLRTDQRVTSADVGRALALAADLYETQFGTFVLEPVVTFAGGQRIESIVQVAPSPRPIRMLAAAFSGELGPESADPNAPIIHPLPRNATAGGKGDWYTWDFRRMDGSFEAGVADSTVASLGAAGALHFLRVHLLRLATLTSGFVDLARVEEAIDLIDHNVGAVWTEHDQTGDSRCQCVGAPPFVFCPSPGDQAFYLPCKNCYCAVERPINANRRWDLYLLAATLVEG